MKAQAGLGEGLGSAFLAVDDGEHEGNARAGFLRRLRGLECGFSGRGDVLDNGDRPAGKGSPLVRPSTRSFAPCSFGFLRTKKFGKGFPVIQLKAATAPEIGTAPISSPPIASSFSCASASSDNCARSAAPSGSSIVGLRLK